jgi:gas vesicle protein
MLRKKNNTGKKVAVGASLAAVVGYVAGILTAPKSGKDTRKDLADKAVEVKGGAQTQLEGTLKDLTESLKKAKAQSVKLNAKARQEYDEAVVKAKDAQNKASQVLKAVRAGEAENPELNKAVKQGQTALKNLSKFLKS